MITNSYILTFENKLFCIVVFAVIATHYPTMVNHLRIILEHLPSFLGSAFSQKLRHYPT